MSFRPNRFSECFYNGDWQTCLVDAIKLAKEGNCSKEVLGIIEGLERQLAQADECVHTVTAVQVVPESMSSQFLLNQIKKCVDVEPATLNLASIGEIELTITARGSREHVLYMAQAILSSGLAHAKVRI